jgi:phosphoribosylformylglycinamidine (FGAM) synthase PurS component
MATLADDASTLALPMDGLGPGPVMIMGQAQSNGMLDYDFMLDFNLEKASAPPVIEIEVNLDGTNATWDASYLKFTLQGKVLDPDGEAVSMSLTLCGYSTNDFVRSGVIWEIDVNIVSCSSQNPPVTTYDITLVATDDSGTMTTMQVLVPDPYANSQDPGVDSPITVEESVPAASMLATLSITLLGAAVVNQRKKQ